MVGYAPSSFVDLVFSGERIKVGLEKGKSDHPALMNVKTEANEEGENEGETHAATAIPIRPTPNKAPTFGHHFCSKSRKGGIFGVVKRISTCGTSKFQIVMAAQLIHDRVEMECLEGAWETLEGNARCRFRGTIRFTATSLVHPDEPARTLQRTVEWILPMPTPYRLVEPIQVIEVTSSEEDPEEDLEELPPEPVVDALDFLEGDEDPLPEVDSPEDVMSASEADSTEDSRLFYGLHEGFYLLWNARGVVGGDTEGLPKCFQGVYHQLLALQWHIRAKARSRLDCDGEFHVSPPRFRRHVHDQFGVVGSQWRFYQVKVKSLDTISIKELGRLMEPLQMQAFRKTYGKILELTIAEVSIEAIASLTQYYDQPLRCFTFGDFQLVPTIEEFEEILGCPLGGRKPYLSSGCLPSLSRIATVVKDSARGLDRIKQTWNGIVGLPQRYLEDKARGMANQGDWVPFMDVLALLIFGVVLFPNVDGLVDLAAIDAFLAYHHSKESPVVAVLADLFDTFDRRCEKSSARIICCLPALCVWLVSHLFQQDTRHPCPLLSHRSWFPRWKEGKEGVLFSCGRYPNIPLVGTRGCINYNPALAIRQLGYPMRGAPTEESMSPSLVRDFGAQNSKTIQRIHKAWETPLRKDQELRGIRNGIIGGYHEWLKVHIRGLDWLAKLKVVSEESFEAPEEDEEVQALKSELGKAKFAKEKFKLVATHIRKECAGLREENAITARALEQETKRARKEEYGRNKFRGALWGSNSELKLRREERDQSRAHSMVLKEELIACSRSKRSLSQRLCETETNMLAIIAKYQEELGLATAHEHRIADEYAQVYAEKEARGRVIDSLHQEATMWMDRFALTLNGSQELPRLLAKAKAMADTYSTPEEIHGLLGYCQHMIDLMAHIIRNQETQEQMKADMSALKEQMASMMEAMLSMKQLIEKNAATATAVSSAAEADPTLLATTHHPPSNIVGRGKDTLGHDGSPHLGYNRAAYPYGLPPNYSPPVLQEDAGHIASPPDEVHKDPQDYARRDVEFYPPIPEGPAPGTLPQPNIAAPPIRWRDLAAQVAPPMVEREMITMMVDTLPVFYMPSSFADLVFAGERIEVGLKRGKFDYVSSTDANAKRIGATGAKRKEGDAHAVSSTPAWVKPQQTPHGTHQYAQHHPSFSAHTGNASSSTPVQPKAPTHREAPQVPTPNTTRPAGNSNTTRNFPPRPFPEFTTLPMTYEDLLPSLIANHLAVVTPGRVLEPPFPKWLPWGCPRAFRRKCLALKYKVQHLMDAGWLTFQEDRPNVRTNPLANHGGGAVNAVESDRPHRSKPLRDVTTPRRLSLRPYKKEMIDQGRLEVGSEGKEEQHICMQSMEGSSVAKPKPLTKIASTWPVRYTPPRRRKKPLGRHYCRLK
ncbi:hypothetical protein GmHk_06G016942 [Glycine max]|nr:hypothetical protein GmHk_06G016942 [Glycine max]